MPKTYFYACSYPLERGSIVQPGNWGRILRLESVGNQKPFQHFKEQLFENVRFREFQALPGRQEATFMCETLQDLMNFKRESCRGFDLCYEVEPVDSAAPIHRTCMGIFESAVQTDPPVVVEEKARRYWGAVGISKPEVLTLSPIRILLRHP